MLVKFENVFWELFLFGNLKKILT